MANILVCDDDMDIVSALTIYFEGEGFSVYTAYNGKQALNIIDEEKMDLVIMDVMMPEMDGITAVSKLREKTNIPVILLTAKSEEQDKVSGLTIGADDYVTKPFNAPELVARAKAQLRRYMNLGGLSVSAADPKAEPGVLCVGGILLNDHTKTVDVDGVPVTLTPTEFDILKFLMEHPGKVFTSAEIYNGVWNQEPIGAEGTVSVHIRHLRQKIETVPSEPSHLKVIWGQGYKIEG